MSSGPLLLLIAGAALIGTGLWQLAKAAGADFLRHLDGRVANQAWVLWLSRAGYAARGLVFVIIGWSLLQAGLSDSAAQAGGMEQALGSLSGALLSGVAWGCCCSACSASSRRGTARSTIRTWRRDWRGRFGLEAACGFQGDLAEGLSSSAKLESSRA